MDLRDLSQFVLRPAKERSRSATLFRRHAPAPLRNFNPGSLPFVNSTPAASRAARMAARLSTGGSGAGQDMDMSLTSWFVSRVLLTIALARRLAPVTPKARFAQIPELCAASLPRCLSQQRVTSWAHRLPTACQTALLVPAFPPTSLSASVHSVSDFRATRLIWHEHHGDSSLGDLRPIEAAGVEFTNGDQPGVRMNRR
jgi:hypothetical protein